MQPSLTEVASYSMKGDVQARSVILVTLEGVDYLVVGLGDGQLVSLEVTAAVDARGVVESCTLSAAKKACPCASA